MKSTLAALLLAGTLSYAPEIRSDSFIPKTAEMKEKSEENAAEELYSKMRQKDDILLLFFESYGRKHTGFHVGRNLPEEEKYLILHADDNENRRSIDIKVNSDFQSIESVILRNRKDGEVYKEINVPRDDREVLFLYGRMLGTSIEYVDSAEVTKHPVIGNFAKYNTFIQDKEFVSALENLMSKNGM